MRAVFDWPMVCYKRSTISPMQSTRGAEATGTFRYIALYKPYGMLSQFSEIAETNHATLASLGLPFDVYPVGRLDHDSEGLLILSDDRTLVKRLLEPQTAHPRTYLIQVEGSPDDDALERLRNGVMVQGRITARARARRVEPPADLPERPVPIRYRANIPTSWMMLTLLEGRNRQVRKMTAAVGVPTLRLLRVMIGSLNLFNLGLAPGEWRDLTSAEVRLLKKR